jgi:1-deoxy-D-xylulose-5-phosphate synthase
VGLTEQDIARRIAEWTAVLSERDENDIVTPAEKA